MTLPLTFILACGIGLASASTAVAACSGELGRGWSRGQGNGAFQMTAADRSCTIGYANFINDSNNTSIAATEIKLTKAPKSGDIGVSDGGVVYTPKAGFKGQDKFCTSNTSPQVKGKKLSGCITVTVN